MANSGKTKDSFLNAYIRHIWFITAVHDIDLQLIRIQGHKNIIADSLSRIHSEKGIPYKTLEHLKNSYIWETIPVTYFNLEICI